MINVKEQTVSSVFKNLSINISTTFKFCLSLENAIEFCILGYNPLELPNGGAVTFCDTKQGRGIFVRSNKEIILLFKEDGIRGVKDEVVSITYFNQELYTKKATLKDLLDIKEHINALYSTELLNKVEENVNIFTTNNKDAFMNDSDVMKAVKTVNEEKATVEGTFTMEEMQQVFKKPVVPETEQTQPESSQPQPIVEKVAESTPEPAPTPEHATVEEPSEPTMKEETKAAEPPKTTPKETPFYKKKSFWVGAGCAVGVGAAVAWRVRAKLS